jgi:hypothetical protein
MDRSKCRECARLGIETILTNENSYKRKDTYNKLHSYCKACYLKMQKERTTSIAVEGKKFTTIVRNGSYKSKRIFFDSLKEKRDFIVGRKSLCKCYRSNDTLNCMHIGSTAMEGDPELCDECGSLLKYDKRGFLCCDSCGLCADIVPLYREIGISMLHGRHAWNGEEADGMCTDTYYTAAYGRV